MLFINQLYMCVIVVGMMISVISFSWMSVWVGLEVTLLFIISYSLIMKLSGKVFLMKYFIIQSASGLLVLGMSFFSWSWVFLSVCFLLKLGFFPFHYWYVDLLSNSSWGGIMFFSTLVKIVPLYLLAVVSSSAFVALTSVIMLVVGSFGGMQSVSLRLLMAYSSLMHLSWVGGMLVLDSGYWFFYFVFYVVLSLSVMMHFMSSFVYYLGQLIYQEGGKSLALGMLSLGGMPPTMGFSIKWLGLQLLVDFSYSMVFLFAVLSVVTLYFYVRLFVGVLILSVNSRSVLNIFWTSSVGGILLYSVGLWLFCL